MSRSAIQNAHLNLYSTPILPQASQQCASVSTSPDLESAHTQRQILEDWRLIMRVCHDFPSGNARIVLYTSPSLLAIVKGSGCECTSAKRDVYVNFLGEYSASIFGHSNKVIETAANVAIRNGWSCGGPNPYEWKLARKVDYFHFVQGL